MEEENPNEEDPTTEAQESVNGEEEQVNKTQDDVEVDDEEEEEMVANFEGLSIEQTTTTFYAFPGQRNAGKIINYNTKNGRDHYEKATAPLEAETYDCGADGFFQFSKEIGRRAEAFGWTGEKGIAWVIKGRKEINIFTDYGRLTLEEVRSHVATYIGSETRKAQDDFMLYSCIMNSLNRSGRMKMNVRESDFKFGQKRLPSGVALFKVLVQESHIDSNATTAVIREKLQNLDAYLQEVGNDIQKFNNYVMVLMESLSARGETSSDLLIHLFTAYASCSDQQFVRYIQLKQSDYEDGNPITPRQLMDRALGRYKSLCTKNLWEAQTDEQKKLVALEAEIQTLKRGKGSNQSASNQKRNRTHESDRRPSKKRKGQPKKTPKKEKPKWMFERPADSELFKPREWNGRMWHYCAKCTGGKCDPGRYTVHKPSECKGKEFFRKNKSYKKNERSNGYTKKVTIKEAVDEISGGYISSGSE